LSLPKSFGKFENYDLPWGWHGHGHVFWTDIYCYSGAKAAQRAVKWSPIPL